MDAATSSPAPENTGQTIHTEGPRQEKNIETSGTLPVLGDKERAGQGCTASFTVPSEPPHRATIASKKEAPSTPHRGDDRKCTGSSEVPAPDTITPAQRECLAAIAYLVGSPLQRRQPSASMSAAAAVEPSLLLACELLERGVDVERVVELVEARSSTSF